MLKARLIGLESEIDMCTIMVRHFNILLSGTLSGTDKTDKISQWVCCLFVLSFSLSLFLSFFVLFLVPLPGIEPVPCTVKAHRVLTTGLPGNSLNEILNYWIKKNWKNQINGDRIKENQSPKYACQKFRGRWKAGLLNEVNSFKQHGIITGIENQVNGAIHSQVTELYKCRI